jgi:hypothetical protein
MECPLLPARGFTLGDFNGDGIVNSADIVLFYSNLGTNLNNLWLKADLNADGAVNAADLAIIANNLGSNGSWADGDFNGNGVVDDGDVDLAFAQYGLELSLVI